jgi:membrane protein required for colicin V production
MTVVFLGSTILGGIKGFAWQLASFSSVTLSSAVAYYGRDTIAAHIPAQSPWHSIIATLILFVGTSLAVWIFFRWISAAIGRLKLKDFDRQTGAIFGLVKGLFYCCLITLVGSATLTDEARQNIQSSITAKLMRQVIPYTESIIPGEYLNTIKLHLNGQKEPQNKQNRP